MSIFRPLDSSSASKSTFWPGTSWVPTQEDLKHFAAPKCTTPCHPPCGSEDHAPPPEMPDAIQAHSLKRMPCFYGFEFPDAAVLAYNKAHAIERLDGEDLQAWVDWSKRNIMNDHARELGIRFSAHLAVHAVVSSGSPGACQEDVVHFAYVTQGRLVASQCLTTQKIQQFMRILGIPGEPRWIMA